MKQSKNMRIENIQNQINEILDILEKKNKSYNNSYELTRNEFGNIIFIIRLQDKLNRLKSLIMNNKLEYFSESYNDTIKDIIGYCLLELDYLTRHNKNNETEVK